MNGLAHANRYRTLETGEAWGKSYLVFRDFS